MAAPHEHGDPELERLLRCARPEPDERFVAAVERRLFGRPPARGRSRLRTLTVALGATLALAAAAAILALAGAGPFGKEGDAVRAKDDCRMVRVTEVRRKPVLVEGRDGRATIRYERTRTSRLVKRCR
jgi:hypothetical protein